MFHFNIKLEMQRRQGKYQSLGKITEHKVAYLTKGAVLNTDQPCIVISFLSVVFLKNSVPCNDAAMFSATNKAF